MLSIVSQIIAVVIVIAISTLLVLTDKHSEQK